MAKFHPMRQKTKPIAMQFRGPLRAEQIRVALCIAFALASAECRRATAKVEGDAGNAAELARAATPVSPNPSSAPAPKGPKLGATALQVGIYSRPDGSSKRIGYLRLGASVTRDPEPAGSAGCSGGWYHVQPRGFVCSGEDATLDMNHPLLRAASVRPDTTKPMPYRYAFVRAVAPLYLRIPNAKEQYSAEFKLADHLDWFKQRGEEANKVILGANDVAIDARGVPSRRPSDTGEVRPASVPSRRPSTDLSMAELLGAQGEADPIPFWLQGGRSVPNVSDFKVPSYAYFANRVRRHTGLALVGSFPTGPDSLDRRFAITVDLRLVPASKIKPDTGSPFHGAELTSDFTLPVAFVRTECEKDGSCAHTYKLTGEGAHREERTLPFRTLVQLSGQTKRTGGSLYREAKDGAWLKASDLGVANAPAEWPTAATSGQKWIDISIENQLLTLWEGQKPVYVTLVSTGQDGLGDPKTTKSTITGTFRIKSKHVTATMDSNEHSSQGGGAAPQAQAEVKEVKEGKDAKTATEAPKDAVKSKAAPVDSAGRQVRRGEGTFELRDVPYVQYFEAGYALHAAYWHDVFGKARSHGCVNLSPVDAHRVFQFSDPPVPDAWHGVTSEKEGDGSVVFIHK
ncbi:MAG TPA: L,D-transpeptidase family protein [Polyangiaceae bacterium]|nr:L,D-transpeptidase family protein [Polyangiaceae bacterium]